MVRRDAAEVRAGALRWVERNPQAWGAITAKACGYARRGRHFSMRYLLEWARMDLPVDAGGDGFRIENDYIPVFARMLVEQHPECRQYVSLRRTRFDALPEGE